MGKKAAAVSLQGSQQTVAVLFHFPTAFCFSKGNSELKLVVAQSKLHVYVSQQNKTGSIHNLVCFRCLAEKPYLYNQTPNISQICWI